MNEDGYEFGRYGLQRDPAKPAWECVARKQGTAGGNDPADCDWPLCQCDPYANKVMSALDEAGFELTKKATSLRDGRGVIETCAKIAADQYDEQLRRAPRIDDDGSYDIGWRSACDHIAKTIRASVTRAHCCDDTASVQCSDCPRAAPSR